MKRVLVLLACVLALGGAAQAAATATWRAIRAPRLPAPLKPPVYRFEKVAEGVYAAFGAGALSTGANSCLFVGPDDVVVVDTHVGPWTMAWLLDELKTITKLPVKTAIDTHFHWDHAHGNQNFPPGSLVIGHTYTRERLLAERERMQDALLPAVERAAREVERLATEVAAETDAAKRAELQKRLARSRYFADEQKAMVPTPPNVTFDRAMTIFRGGREIQLHFLGRAHTGGDIVVFLPQEKVACTGDLVTMGLAYMGDGYADEWPATLEALKRLPWEKVIPGHGPVFTDRALLDHFAEYLRDFWQQVKALHAAKVPVDEVRARLQLARHRPNFYNYGDGVDPAAVRRAYARLDELAAGGR